VKVFFCVHIENEKKSFKYSKKDCVVLMNGGIDDKKDHIIAVAIETIRKHGVRKTGIQDIADASGMAPATLYYYFQSKADIVRTALDTLMNSAFHDLDVVIKSRATVEAKLTTAVKSIITGFSRSGILLDLNKITRSEMLVMGNDFADKFTRRYKALIKSILSEGIQEGVFYAEDVELTASVLSSAVFGYIMNTLNVDLTELNETWIDEVGKLLMYGLKTR
jgi:AcrR family transcriptional regulator